MYLVKRDGTYFVEWIMKRWTRSEQEIFVLMKFLNGKVEKKFSRIRSMGRWRDTKNDGGRGTKPRPHHSPLGILLLVGCKDVITHPKYLYCKWSQPTFVERFRF